MKFTFYKSKLCPRCAQVRKHLKSFLGAAFSDCCVEIDVVKHPVRTWQGGIRMIPALKFDQTVLSGVILSKEQIRTFLTDHQFFGDKDDQ